MPVPLIKSFAKKTGKSIKEVEELWKKIKQQLIDSGKSETDKYFYAELVSILKRRLKIKEKTIYFTKFKQFLKEIYSEN